jgi:hypothetical protein
LRPTVALACLLALGACAPASRPSGPEGTRARAFRVERAEDLLQGPAATGTVGDYRLDNGLVSFVISDAPVAFGFSESGGNLIDAAPAGQVDELAQVFLYLQSTFPRQALYARVAVAPAPAGSAAVVAEGRDSGDASVEIRTTYTLAAGTRLLELSTTFTNRGPAAIGGYRMGDVIAWGHAEHFLPGVGFVFKGQHGGPWIAGVGELVSYAYGAPGRALAGPHGSAWSDLDVAAIDLAPGQPVTVTRWLAVGDRPDVASATRELVARATGEALTEVQGVVLEESTDRPVGGAVVELGRDRPITTAVTGDDGRFVAWLPRGELTADLVARARAPGRTSTGQAPVAGAGPLTLRVSQAATLTYALAERRGTATVRSPGKLTFEGVPPTATPNLGPHYRAAGAGPIVATARGQGHVVLAPGTYRVHVSRGPEYELVTREITLTAGQTTRLEVVLERVVDTSGYLAADFHQHQLASPDSSVANEDRVIANLAEGLELVVATDHNQITDLAPALARVGAVAPLATVIGVEATTEHIGHFNAYPVPRSPHAPRGGAPLVNQRPVTDIFRDLRALAPDVVVQINHPRSGESGYFDLAGLPPGGGTSAGLPATLDLGFDAVEVLNGKRVDGFDGVLADWLGLLGRGHLVTAVGGSDTHMVFGQEAGYPRAYVALGDDPAAVTGAALLDVIKRRRDVVVTNGPFIAWHRAGQAGRSIIGSTLERGPAGAIDTEIVVSAAGWVDVQRVELWHDGRLVARQQTPRPMGQAKRVTLPWRLDRPGFYVVVVRGDASLAPVVPAVDVPVTPVAVTNPVWVR